MFTFVVLPEYQVPSLSIPHAIERERDREKKETEINRYKEKDRERESVDW